MDNRYAQLENENWFNYAERLINGRKDGIYDLDKAEVYEYLTGEVVSTDHSRKMLCFLEKIINKYNLYRENNIIDDEYIGKNELKLIEIQKERYKLQALRNDLNKTVRETSRSELIYEEFLNELKKSNNIQLPNFVPLNKQNEDREYLLSFADAHFGKEFESITNEYSIEIFYDRFNKLLSEVLSIVSENNISKIHIVSLGDMMDGACLRIGQLSHLKIGIVEQTITLMRFMAKWLNELSKNVEIVYHAVKHSNHTQIRNFGTKANQFEEEDVEKISFAYIKDMLASNLRITVVESEDKYTMFKLFDYNIIATHGHKVKNIKRFLGDVSLKHKIFFDYAIIGHYHHGYMETVNEGQSGNNNCEIITVPSIMGSDDFADDLFVGSKAGATLIEFTRNQGKRVTYDIILN